MDGTDGQENRADAAPLPEADGVQRVEVEAETDPAPKVSGGPGGFTFRFGRAGAGGAFSGSTDGRAGKPPRIAAWVCLGLAWLFLGSSLPFTVFAGVPLAFASVVLGAACLSRGAAATGAAVMALGSVGSFAVYLVGLFRFLIF